MGCAASSALRTANVAQVTHVQPAKSQNVASGPLIITKPGIEVEQTETAKSHLSSSEEASSTGPIAQHAGEPPEHGGTGHEAAHDDSSEDPGQQQPDTGQPTVQPLHLTEEAGSEDGTAATYSAPISPLSRTYASVSLSTRQSLNKSGSLASTASNMSKLFSSMGQSQRIQLPQLTQLLGPELVLGDGRRLELQQEVQQHRLLLLYFAASWAEPCHAFNTKLIAWYNAFKERHELASALQVIYISQDDSLDAFTSFTASMPWPSVPFGSREAADITHQLDVLIVPAVLVLDVGSGKVLSGAGRELVEEDVGAQGAWLTGPSGLDPRLDPS